MGRGISRDGSISTRALGSYIVRMLGVVRSFLRLVKSLSCVGVQSQAFFALNSSRNSLDNSATYVWREFAKLAYHPKESVEF